METQPAPVENWSAKLSRIGRVVFVGVYQLGTVAGGLAIVWHGSSPWLLVLLVPLLILGPRK